MKKGGRFPSFLLTVDVGNTAASLALFSVAPVWANKKPSAVWTFPTGKLETRKSARAAVQQAIRRLKVSPSRTAVIVSSVVPLVNAGLRSAFRRFFPRTPIFVSSVAGSTIRVRTKNPKEVGADRLMNARGAAALWRRPVIVVDFGTATTFDCVTSKGEYVGGVIAPGPAISAEALYLKTAKLPLVFLNKPVRVLGQSTADSIRSGLYFGYRGLIKEIVGALKKRMGSRTMVVGTGGQGPWIWKGLGCVDAVHSHLTHLGLYHTWLDARKKG